MHKTHLGWVHQGQVLPLTYSRVTPYGIKPRNAGQYFMQEALMQPASEAPLVIVKGQAVILVGDPNQIDKPFLDERTNGLTYAAGKMKGSPLCYQLTMMADECERSPLALDAIQRL